ncbi:plant UBX domain-containing protein 7-like [Zingiber officinale]|uniref:plant UBX domain-containing protein 7-like n=1 Tax=Zingiber officinale TaxID=94328 RepID=UPI001C4D66BC|nr:plant UBX domain-containing protein 7-like [Zingiber officinale]
METLPSAAERQQLISFFLEVAADQTADVAARFLEATGWKFDEAVQLFYVSNESGGVESSFLPPQTNGITRCVENMLASGSSVQGALEDEVRAPLPVVRDIFNEDPAFFRSQPSLDVPFGISRHSAIWESSESVLSTSNGTHDNLASLYTPPFSLMFQGRFDQAKVEASLRGKWLLLNLQSHEEFSSHMLNRDTWANQAVAETIHSNFIFWQVYHDNIEGKKVCTYYNLFKLPAVLLIDPITGQKMNAWTGMVHPERLLEGLLPFLDKGPKEHHAFLLLKQKQRAAHDSAVINVAGKEAVKDDVEMVQAIATSLEDTRGPRPLVTDEESRPEKSHATNSNEKLTYPPLLEEPQGSKGLCRVAIRLPDGCRLQRKFLLTDSIKLLWSFCSSKLEDGLKRPFHFIQFYLGASRSLEYEKDLTFDAAGLSNSLISLVWD